MKWLYASTTSLGQSIIGLFSALFFSSIKASRSFNRMRKNIKDNEKAYVLANGPSLKTFLENGEYPSKGVFVLNMFAFSPYFQILKPDNYIVADQLLCGRPTQAQAKFVDSAERVYDIINHIDWDMNMFFPNDVYPSVVEKISSNPHIHVVYYNRTPIEGTKGFRHFMYRHNLGMPTPQNVTNALVFCTINLGYKKVYLYGVEHSWTKNIDCDPEVHRLFINDGHFYNEDEKRYYDRGRYCELLLNIHKMMKSHFLLREYADFVGTKIINKTDNSFIEAYEFDEY